MLGFDGGRQRGIGGKRRQHFVVPRAAPLGRQHGDIGRFQRDAAGKHFGHRPAGEHAAGIQRQQVVELLGFFHIGGGDQHRHARVFRPQLGHQLPKLAARQGIDAGGRLVQDQQFGIVHQRAAQTEFLLHAAGELAGGTLGKGCQAGGIEQAGDALFALAPV